MKRASGLVKVTNRRLNYELGRVKYITHGDIETDLHANLLTANISPPTKQRGVYAA